MDDPIQVQQIVTTVCIESNNYSQIFQRSCVHLLNIYSTITTRSSAAMFFFRTLSALFPPKGADIRHFHCFPQYQHDDEAQCTMVHRMRIYGLSLYLIFAGMCRVTTVKVFTRPAGPLFLPPSCALLVGFLTDFLPSVGQTSAYFHVDGINAFR